MKERRGAFFFILSEKQASRADQLHIGFKVQSHPNGEVLKRRQILQGEKASGNKLSNFDFK